MTDPALGKVPTGPHAHSVSAEARTGRVFDLIAGGCGSPWPQGGLEAIGARSPLEILRDGRGHAARSIYQQVEVESLPEESCAACTPMELTVNVAQLVSSVCVPIAVAVSRKDGGFAALSTLVTAIS
jgi:hypothetical protein